MGTGGHSLFHDDVARDVRARYLELLAGGASDRTALHTLQHEWAEEISDGDDGPVFWLALAATQWELGRLAAGVKTRALRIISSGLDDRRWIGSPLRGKRRAVLEQLLRRLQSPAGPKRTPRARPCRPDESVTAKSPDGAAEATVAVMGRTGKSGSPLCQVIVSMKVERMVGGGGVFAAWCPLSAIRLAWSTSKTLRISYPKRARIDQRERSTYFNGRVVALRYRAY